MADQTPRPMRCQIPSGGCEMPPVFLLTFEAAPLTGRFAGPGLTWTEALCRHHCDPRTNQIREARGQLIAVDDLPPLPEPVQPTPIGLDAIAPVTTIEPAPPARPRRRRARAQER